MEEGQTSQSVWNFDGAELYLIFQIKNKIVDSFELWDLETCYWKLRLLRMELDAKLQRVINKMIDEFEEKKEKKKTQTEKQILDDKLKFMDNKYSVYKDISNPNDDEKSSFYQCLEEFYMHLCWLMKKHGLYFREGEDMRLAVLRR
jgi:hypothetical protein